MVNENKLTEVDIELILNAIDTSKEALMKVYTKDWLETKIDVIKDKLDAQMSEVKNIHSIKFARSADFHFNDVSSCPWAGTRTYIVSRLRTRTYIDCRVGHENLTESSMRNCVNYQFVRTYILISFRPPILKKLHPPSC